MGQPALGGQQLDGLARQAPGEERPEVVGVILPDAPGEGDPRVLLAGELQVGVGLVVP